MRTGFHDSRDCRGRYQDNSQINMMRNGLKGREAGQAFYFRMVGIDGINSPIIPIKQILNRLVSTLAGTGANDGDGRRIEK